MAALAGFGAAQQEDKAIKIPPPLFPIPKDCTEPGDFPRLRPPPIDATQRELIVFQRHLRANFKIAPYYIKPASPDRDVERYSDALKRDEEAVLEYLHTRSRCLPRALRAEPLPRGEESLAMETHHHHQSSFMDYDTLMMGEVPTSLPGIPLELMAGLTAYDQHSYDAVPASGAVPAKRKVAANDGGAREADRPKKKAKKGGEKNGGGAEENGQQKTKLDFANLTKHKLVELREFCRENGIVGSYRNKKAYADAILAWHQQQPKPAPATSKTSSSSAKGKEKATNNAAPRPQTQQQPQPQQQQQPLGEAVAANGAQVPRPLDRMSRLAMLEEEEPEEGEEGAQSNKSRQVDDEEEEDENDYNERYDSEAEDDDDDDDDDNEPTF